MKKPLLSLAFALSFYVTYAQNTYPWPSVGNVTIRSGINTLPAASGTNQSGSALRVEGGDNAVIDFGTYSVNTWLQATDKTDLSYKYNLNLNPMGGNVGVGTASPRRTLDVSNAGQITFGDDVVTSSTNGIYWHSGPNYGIYRTSGPWAGNAYQQLKIQFDTGIQLGAGVSPTNPGYEKSYVEIISGKGLMVSSGRVGIGTTNPDQLLSVKGTIHSQEVKVDMLNWSDYVFKPTYKLRPLSEVKAYIDKNEHLPEIPSEAEVVKSGVNLGEIVKLQTKKIEELTLYLIEKDKEVKQQQALSQTQQTQIDELRRQVETLLKKKL